MRNRQLSAGSSTLRTLKNGRPLERKCSELFRTVDIRESLDGSPILHYLSPDVERFMESLKCDVRDLRSGLAQSIRDLEPVQIRFGPVPVREDRHHWRIERAIMKPLILSAPLRVMSSAFTVRELNLHCKKRSVYRECARELLSRHSRLFTKLQELRSYPQVSTDHFRCRHLYDLENTTSELDEWGIAMSNTTVAGFHVNTLLKLMRCASQCKSWNKFWR